MKKATLQARYDREDNARLASAFSQVAASTDLRYMLRTILYNLAEMQTSAFQTGSPDGVAFTLGRQSIGIELANMMEAIDSSLQPRLLQETIDDRRARNAELRACDDSD